MTERAPSPCDGTAPCGGVEAAARLGVKGVVTFFYYDDLPGAVVFYEHVIGFNKLMQNEWCGLFELQPGTVLGLVNAEAGSQKPIAGRNKGAILSIETDRLEDCLSRMKAVGVAAQDTELEPGCAGRTWEFKIYDPEGYCLEFFRWIAPPHGSAPVA